MAEVTPYREDLLQVLEHLDLSVLSGCSLLVTGATGLIGGCLTDLLMAQSHCEVYALGRNEERARRRFSDYWDDERFHFVKGDVTEPLSGEQHYDYIIHAASNASPNFFQQQPVEVIMANVSGVRNLMEYGLRHGMKRLLYVSTGEIYGEGTGGVFTETDSGYVDCATVWLMLQNTVPMSSSGVLAILTVPILRRATTVSMRSLSATCWQARIS